MLFFHSEPERDEWGMDLSLLRLNLSLTPEERLIRHQSALDLALELQNAGKKLGYGPKPATQNSR